MIPCMGLSQWYGENALSSQYLQAMQGIIYFLWASIRGGPVISGVGNQTP